jgi:hypothetical protein
MEVQMDLQEWFETIQLDDIVQFMDTAEQEDLHLEFKTVNKPDLSHTDDRRNFARALSGFANTSGGIVVWGVSAKKNADSADNIDCAQKSDPVPKISLFCSRLQSLTGAWIDPPVKGVRHRPLPVDEATDEGFALTYVPQSESGPHIVTLNKEYRYYMRVGDSFEPMPHSHVADRFFRKRRPKLKLYLSNRDSRVGRIGERNFLLVDLIIGIENEGKAIAKYPYLLVKVHKPFEVSLDGLFQRRDGLRKLRHQHPDEPHRWAADGNDVVHPESYLEVAKIVGKIEDLDGGDYSPVVIDYQIMAEDAEFTSGQKRLLIEDIIKQARKA